MEASGIPLNNGVCDFGIVSIALSDSEMPDDALDRYNEINQFKHENKL